MNRNGIIEYLNPEWTRVNGFIADAVSTDVPLLSSVNGEILGHGGKMLRPMICLLIARACGGTNDDSVAYAAASELLHNATLLHDDVADSSSERRGNPTVNATFGASTAVLVGDFWLSRAVAAVIHTSAYREVAELFSKTLTDLAEGEMLQLQKASSGDTDKDDYFRIIYCKTASLFVSAALSAAISTGATEKYKKAAEEFSRCFGMAFQIKDDILDYAGDEELGKPVGADLREKKITLPLLCALENSPLDAEIRRRFSLLSDEKDVQEIRKFVMDNGGLEKASVILDSFIGRAVRSLDDFPDSEAKFYLSQIAHYNAFRRQ